MPDQEAGQQLNHVLQQAAPIQLRLLAVLSLSILHAAYQAVRLELKHTELGQHTVAVYKVNVPDQEAGQQYRLILILAVIALQQKLMAQILSTLHAVLLVVLLVQKIIAHGDHGGLAVKGSKLELEHGLRLRHV